MNPPMTNHPMLRVLTFNTNTSPWRLTSRTQAQCDEILRLAPDVVCLQEVAFASTLRAIRARVTPEYLVIGTPPDKPWYRWTAYLPVMAMVLLGFPRLALLLLPQVVWYVAVFLAGGAIDTQGLVVLLRRDTIGRHPFTQYRKPFTVQGYAARWWNPCWWWFETTYFRPGYQRIRFDKLDLINCHLVVGPTANRAAQVEELQRVLADVPRVVWAGDMNAPAAELGPVMECHTVDGATCSDGRNIDMVWSTGFAPQATAVRCLDQGDLSDHTGVLVSLVYPV